MNDKSFPDTVILESEIENKTENQAEAEKVKEKIKSKLSGEPKKRKKSTAYERKKRKQELKEQSELLKSSVGFVGNVICSALNADPMEDDEIEIISTDLALLMNKYFDELNMQYKEEIKTVLDITGIVGKRLTKKKEADK